MIVRLIKDRHYGVSYMRPYEYVISQWLNERDIDSYFDEFTTDKKVEYNCETSIGMRLVSVTQVTRTNFVCFRESEDAAAFLLAFGEYNIRG